MNLSLFIARRYFFSQQKKSFINVISIISMIGVAVGSAALVIALSVFNGLEELIRSLYGTFDPELRITAQTGKSFEVDSLFLQRVAAVPGVGVVTEVIEDNALLRYQDAQMVAKVKGVSDNFITQQRMANVMVGGQLRFYDEQDGREMAIVGLGVQYALGISLKNEFALLQVWYPRTSRRLGLTVESAFNRSSLAPGGVFAIEKQYDDQYIFVPLRFAQDLMNYGARRTALEIKTVPDAGIRRVQSQLRAELGEAFLVQNSDEQHASLLRAIRVERLFVFLTFAFIIFIASFNIFFSLSMLAIEKKRDVAVLYALGATRSFVRRMFMTEGALIAFIGAGVGLSVGWLVCWLQARYELISMGMETAVTDAYPVAIDPLDFLLSGALIVLITLLATYRPAARAAREAEQRQLQL